MKFVLRNNEKWKEPKVEFWLEVDSDRTVWLKARKAGSLQSWGVLSIESDGLRILPSIGEDLGFAVDRSGGIRIVK